jgi:hypothetical protein
MKANTHPMLDNSTLVLGDPGLREPYGFLHFSPEKVILTLRNPFVRPAQINMRLDESAGFEPTEKTYGAEILFPFRESIAGTYSYGGTIITELGAYEQRVIEMRPVNRQEVRLIGARYSVMPAGSGEVSLRVFGAEGSETPIRLRDSAAIAETRIDGRETQDRREGDELVFPLQFGIKKTRESTVSISSTSVRSGTDGDGAAVLNVSTSIQVPTNFRETKLAVLLEPSQEVKGITASARENGAAVPASTENGGRGLWYWFSTELKPGNHSVNFAIRFPKGSQTSSRLSGWLLGKRGLISRELKLKLKPGARLDLPPGDLLLASTEVERVTYPVFEKSLP